MSHAGIVHPAMPALRYSFTMSDLYLAPTKFGFGGTDDYVVLDGERVIGRIVRLPNPPKGRPWFWAITAADKTPSVRNKGHAATCEEAMADFKARWLVQPLGR
jgi:hypothetical protein